MKLDMNLRAEKNDFQLLLFEKIEEAKNLRAFRLIGSIYRFIF